MKRLVSIFVMLVISSCLSAAAKPTFIFNMGFHPESLQAKFQVRLTQMVFDKLDVPTGFIRVPAERALHNVNQGLDDGNLVRIAGMASQYTNLIQVDEKIIDYDFVVFSFDESLTVTDWAGLNGLDIAIVNGWKILENNITSYKSLTKTDNGEKLFQLMAKQRVDAVVYERLQGQLILNELGIKGVVVKEPALAVRPMYMYVSNRHASLVPDIEQALSEIKQSGRYSQLVAEIYGK